MKRGTQTGSIINRFYSRATIGQPEPTVGMGATVLLLTDRKAATITGVQEVRNKIIVTVKYDRTIVLSGSSHDGSAEYGFSPDPNPNASELHFRREADGGWQAVTINDETGRWKKLNVYDLRIGAREEYRDPSF